MKLAIAAFEAAELESEVVRLAVESDDPSLLSRAGRFYERSSDLIKAGKLRWDYLNTRLCRKDPSTTDAYEDDPEFSDPSEFRCN